MRYQIKKFKLSFYQSFPSLPPCDSFGTQLLSLSTTLLRQMNLVFTDPGQTKGASSGPQGRHVDLEMIMICGVHLRSDRLLKIRGCSFIKRRRTSLKFTLGGAPCSTMHPLSLYSFQVVCQKLFFSRGEMYYSRYQHGGIRICGVGHLGHRRFHLWHNQISSRVCSRKKRTLYYP